MGGRHQFYVTHCAVGDNVLGTAGWGVRAASPADPRYAKLALDLPAYELPMDLWARRPDRLAAPRRLARLPGPDGGVWAAHSAYLETDTMGRDRSFFSHLLLLPPAEAAPAAVLRSWAAPGWATDYAPGKTQRLDAPDPLADGPVISDAAVTAFLTDPGYPPYPADAAVEVCPERLADVAKRRQLLAKVMRGVVAAVECRDAARARFFVHAEPGLLALLLYGAVRLLPPAWTTDLTFTTFEPAHRNLREYKLARVVGTFHGNPTRPLDPDLLATRGIGLNTFLPDDPTKSSAEFRPPPTEYDDLLDLAAADEWGLVDRVHEMLGGDRAPAARLAGVVRVARAADRLDRGTASVADLLDLKADPNGAALLVAKGEAAWPTIRAAVIGHAADPLVAEAREAFAAVVRAQHRLAELRADAVAALRAGDEAGWDARWGAVRAAADPPGLARQLNAVFGELGPAAADLAPAARARLRREAPPPPWPAADPVFAPLDAAELDAILADPGCGDARKGQALAAGLRDAQRVKGLAAAVARHVMTVPVPVLAGFVATARKPVDALLPLLLKDGEPSQRLLGSLIEAGGDGLDPDGWWTLVAKLGLHKARWDAVMLDRNRLAAVLVGLQAHPKAPELWAAVLKRLTHKLIGGESEAEVRIVEQLQVAADWLNAKGYDAAEIVPEAEGARGKFAAALVLARIGRDPADTADLRPNPRDALWGAFAAFEFPKPTGGLRRLFRARFMHRGPDDADPFLALFAVCYPTASGFHGYNTALTEWLWVVKDAPNEAAWQLKFAATIPSEVGGRKVLKPVLAERREADLLPEVRDALEDSEPIIKKPDRPKDGRKGWFGS